MGSYYTVLIILITTTLYLVSHFLVKKNKLQLITHKKIWNTILLITFIINAFLGITLGFTLDNKIFLSWYRLGRWIHVVSGMIMATVSFFHALWHFSYYKNIFIKNKKSL